MLDFVPQALLDALSPAMLLAQQDDSGISWQNYAILAAVLAVCVVPFLIGNALAKSLKMPTYGSRVGAILFAVIASAMVLVFGKLDYGVDLRGGTILVYELDPTASVQASDDGEMRPVSAETVIPALIRRINPGGTKEIQIRPYGDTQIEIIIPEKGDEAIEDIKRQITQAGILQFFIVANSLKHESLVEAASEQSTSENRSVRLSRKVTDSVDKQIGYWADVSRASAEEATEDGVRPLRIDLLGSGGSPRIFPSIVRNADTGAFVSLPPQLGGVNEGANIAAYMKQQGIRDLQILMVVNETLRITGEQLSFAARGFDTDGSPSVRFSLKDSGSARFSKLTGNNVPQNNIKYQLGIVLDDELLSAPTINSAISGSGTISGNFTKEEVDFLVNILQAGQLPGAINKTPISENRIGSTLGADTIRKGITAISVSLGLVLLFVLFYYRFAGIVACTALILNLVMIMAMMILINQPITLPGLAGLVLTVGMSVDANVLIFERIREELRKGAAARMAVRNGFARATTTIVDANLTTLITAIVLYAIGTDQIRGFAVTLILGILFSMFTAIYVSRTLFDIAERKHKLSLGMSDMVSSIRNVLTGNKDFDFMGKGTIAMTLSVVLIIVGLVALFDRRGEILDIDFAGGSSVTFQLEESMTADKVRDLVAVSLQAGEDGAPVQFTLNSVDVASAAKDTVYKVDAGFEDDETLKQLIFAGFANSPDAKLITYQVDIRDMESGTRTPQTEAPDSAAPATDPSLTPEPTDTGNWQRDNGTRLIAAWQQAEEPAQPPTAEEPAPADPLANAEPPAEEPAAEEPPADDKPVVIAPDSFIPPTAPAVIEAGTASEVATDEDVAAIDTAGDAAPAAGTDPTVISEQIFSEFVLDLSIAGTEDKATLNYEDLSILLLNAAEAADVVLERLDIQAEPLPEDPSDSVQVEQITTWTPESSLTFASWNVILELPAQQADQVVEQLKASMNNNPVWLSSNEISGRVAGQMVNRAAAAMFTSLLFIIAYIWFRFQRVAFGFAAVVALIHDVLITLGAIAISHWVAGFFGFLLIEEFKISLTVVAALLTIVGYSLNDTIVVFDRIRETRGKSPRLTAEMINSSINMTLSRTLLTSLTTFMVVALLYFFGGSGIHAFAFSLVIGVIVGTYSSVFVASPVLLWLVNRDPKTV